ncbi:FxSxx-COOH cyclophane-containing RiPP peptide [Actinoallomurus sp. CA-150999]|uniref:FxSxx-COOH cyclophane-containing RiPP peptide n=1 Tax=Actinoallomurus sp. CA-150999 TaxID=3239887 RepID=UPI003D8CC4D3
MGEDDFGGGIIDLSGLSLQDLDDLADSVLVAEVREMLDSSSLDAGVVAGFNSSV